MAGSIIRCLRECFSGEGLFLSALDADTGHEEGATYLWGFVELEEILGSEGLAAIRQVYDISKEGNFEGRNHLVRLSHARLPELEEKLLKARLEREQPEADTKKLCGINALVVIALFQAGKFLGIQDYIKDAVSLFQTILETFWDGKRLAHCLSGGVLQEQSFLFDAASLLAAVSMIAGEDSAWLGIMDEFQKYILDFSGMKRRMESRPEDFHHVPAPFSITLLRRALLGALCHGRAELALVKSLGKRHSDSPSLQISSTWLPLWAVNSFHSEGEEGEKTSSENH